MLPQPDTMRESYPHLSTTFGDLWTTSIVNAVTGVTLTAVASRFLALADVAEVLNVSAAQAYALVRSGELKAIKVGGRGQWRVEQTQLEAYIKRCYEKTEEFIETHPFGVDDEGETDSG
jgi:excisionase family DNA binding protein